MNMCNRVIATTVAATIVLTTLTGCSSNSEKALKANTQPTVDQTAFVELTNAPTEQPTATPTVSPTIEPTETPTEEPTVIPTATLQAELPLAPLADDGMTTVQRNSMGMLNYLSVLTQEINASQNSRMYLEQAYSLLINNTYPNSVDSRTLFQISGLLDILEKYRMIAVKRERLEYVYDQNRAQALRSAIPNPLGLLSAVQSFSLSRLAVSVVYMAVDSLSSYASNTAQADMQYLQNGWALDDEAAEALHQSRKSMFSYLVRSVDDYDLPGDLTLSESSVQDFVKWENNDNVERRIRFLEQNESTYCALGTYWIVLAESYYQNGQYEKCLNAISAYETMGTRLFRKDYEFARVLPLAIISAGNILPESEYIEKTVHYSQLILDNSNYDDWVSRYFVAQTYVDLFAKTKNSTYLRFAYELAKDNVNSLVSVQQELNTKYLAPIEKIAEPDGATKEQKADVKAYNNMLETNRKVELPPVSEPLVLNCELLFALADELKIDTAERTSISRILHQNDERLFLIYSLDDRFSVPSKALSLNDIEVDFDGKTLKIPAWLVPAESVISVTVKQASGETVLFHDWKLAKVDRKIEGELDSFVALFSSEAAKKHKFRSGDIVTISISLDTTRKYDDLSFVFEAKSEKNWLQIEQIRFYRES